MSGTWLIKKTKKTAPSEEFQNTGKHDTSNTRMHGSPPSWLCTGTSVKISEINIFS